MIQQELDPSVEIEIIDLNDYEMPIYSFDREASDGVPFAARRFIDRIRNSDALLISFAEYNGSYTPAYKNTFDWASRIDAKVFQDRPMVMLSVSPGKRGGASVLRSAIESAPYFGGDVKASLSIAQFPEGFDEPEGRFTDPDIAAKLLDTLAALLPTT